MFDINARKPRLFARPFKHTQSQYVLRAWLAVCQLRVPQVSLLVSGPLLKV
jgi:hypothetical protein